jgi:catechol 2,3-dioxygenase-like lactoylglutathione lyase family enzyme
MSDWTTSADPLMLRIATVTTATPDLDSSERCYAEWLGYRMIERGRVDPSLAWSWDAPAAAGSRFCTMRPEGEMDVFVRLIETPAVPGYRPLTTFGWNAFEIIVDDVPALADKIRSAPFEVIGEPRPLQFMPSIVAMQVVGPAGECLYFTMESGDRETSILPRPSGFVGRTFIVVAGGPDFDAMLRWYVDHFRLRERPVRQSKVRVLQDAQGLDPEETVSLSAIGMKQHGNLLELDGYPVGPGRVAGPRPRTPGHLPPGNAMVTFEVADLSPFASIAITPPQARPESIYGGRRACTLLGPAGELVELVATP